jgi:hypothetical protein
VLPGRSVSRKTPPDETPGEGPLQRGGVVCSEGGFEGLRCRCGPMRNTIHLQATTHNLYPIA